MIDKGLLLKLEESLKAKINEIEALTDNVTLLSFSNGKYIIKEVSLKSKELYDYLASQKVGNILYPKKKIIFDKRIFFVFDYVINLEYPDEKKILDLIDTLDELHKKTSFEIKLEDINFNFKRKIIRFHMVSDFYFINKKFKY